MGSSSGGGGGGGGAVIAPTTDASGLAILLAAAEVAMAGRFGSGGDGLKAPSSSFPARLRSGDHVRGSFLLLKMFCFLRFVFFASICFGGKKKENFSLTR